MSDPVSEVAKATQSVAKTTDKALDASMSFGGWIAKYVGGPVEQGMGIFEDKLRFMRFENRLRLQSKANEAMKRIGLNGPSRAVPLNIAIPIMQSASMEEDEFLQDMWVNLLVNAANADSGIEVQKSFVSLLNELTSLEAKILNTVYSLPNVDPVCDHNIFVATHLLPISIEVINVNKINLYDQTSYPPEPETDLKVALSNLIRVGCIARYTEAMGYGEIFRVIRRSILGQKFIEACRIAKQK